MPYFHIHLLIPAILILLFTQANTSMLDDLNRNLPLEIQDARPADFGSIQIQASVEYERSRNHENLYQVRPQVQYGFSNLGHIQVAGQGKFGSEDNAESGETQIGILHRIIGDQNSSQISIYGELELPTGKKSVSVDSELELIFTQPLLDKDLALHVNLTWIHNTAPRESERENGYRTVFGMHKKVSDQFMVLTDIARIVRKQEQDISNLVEVGTVGAITNDFEMGLGLGVELGEPSSYYRLNVSLQYSFD